MDADIFFLIVHVLFSGKKIIRNQLLCFQSYKTQFYKSMSQIEKEKDERLLDESRWTDSWTNSIQKIKSLY